MLFGFESLELDHRHGHGGWSWWWRSKSVINMASAVLLDYRELWWLLVQPGVWKRD